MTRLFRFLRPHRAPLGPAVFGAVLFVSATALAQQPASPQPASPQQAAPGSADEASERFKRGLEFYNEQDYQNALIAFRRAYELQPSYKVLYNLGQVCFQLTDYACALRNFEKYLKEGGSNVSSDRRAEVERDIAKLQTRIGRLEIVTNVPGVDITVDDTYIGKTPLDNSLPVGAGKHKIVATKEGRVAVTRQVEVAGTDSSRVELEMVSNVTTVEAAQKPSKWTKWTTVGVAGAGALAVAGGITGVLALKASDDLKNQKFVGNTPDSATNSQQSKVKTLSLVTDVFFGAAIVTLGTTLALTFFREPEPEKAEEKGNAEEKTSGIRNLQLGVSASSVSVGGRF